MFESLIGLVGPVINAFSKIRFRKPIKRRIGKEFAKLYIGLNEIIENGTAIIKILEDAQNGVKIDVSKLMMLLFAQAERIKRIRSIVEDSQLETILKVHLPQLDDLTILLGMKGSRIAVLTKQLKVQKLNGYHPEKLVDMRGYQIRWWSKVELVPPTEKPLNKSKIDLNELERLNILFRQFLVNRFEIDEII